MAIKSKNSGAYADIVGVSVKAAGTYAAVQGIYAKSGGSYESVFSGISEKTFSVTLSGVTGATPSSISAIVTIQDNPIIIQLNTTRITGKAPLAIGFDTIGSRSGLLTEAFADIYYSWNFGDAKGEYWAYGAASQDKNIAYGPVADHCFETPGNYTVTVTATDRLGNVQTKTVAIEVTAWAAADTIYIANGAVPVAGVNGVLAGATYYNETTWAGVVSRWAANKRVLCRRGDTWSCTSTTSIPAGCEIGAYGTGSKPVVTSAGATQTPFKLSTGPDDVRVIDWRHVGPGPGVADSGMVSTTNVTPSNLLMLRLESNGSTFGFLSASPEVTNTHLYDSDFQGYGTTGLPTNIAAYFSHAHGVFVRGNSFDQTPSHLVRVGEGQRVVFDSNKFRRPDGAGGGRHAITIRGKGVDTPIWDGVWVENIVLSNNDIDTIGTTATWVLQVAPTNTTVAERIRNVLIERNFVKSDKLPMYFEVSFGLTVRNNICVTTNDQNAIAVSAANGTGTPPPTGVHVYNNTCYKTGSGAFNAVAFNGAGVAGCVLYNTLLYAPLATSPTAWASSFGADEPTESNNSTNMQSLTVRPWASLSPTSVEDYSPTGYPVNAGAQAPVYRDILLNTIIGTPSIGGIQ